MPKCEDCSAIKEEVCLRQGDLMLCETCNKKRFPQYYKDDVHESAPKLRNGKKLSVKSKQEKNKTIVDDVEDETQLKKVEQMLDRDETHVKTHHASTTIPHCCCKTLIPMLNQMSEELKNLHKLVIESRDENEMLRVKLISLTGDFDVTSKAVDQNGPDNDNISFSQPDLNDSEDIIDVDNGENTSSESESETEPSDGPVTKKGEME